MILASEKRRAYNFDKFQCDIVIHYFTEHGATFMRLRGSVYLSY